MSSRHCMTTYRGFSRGFDRSLSQSAHFDLLSEFFLRDVFTLHEVSSFIIMLSGSVQWRLIHPVEKVNRERVLSRNLHTCICNRYLSTLKNIQRISSKACFFHLSASVVSLLLLTLPARVEVLLRTSHRHYSGSESDSEVKERGVKEVVMQKPELSNALKKSKEEALYGFLVADALSMPVHWYYNPNEIKRDYGKWLRGFMAPKGIHPSSILSLSAVDGSGRGTEGSTLLIGNIILHDKLKYWTGRSSTHYHQGMNAGDNTLNAIMALEMIKSMNMRDPKLTRPVKEVRAGVLEDYVRFMTTPGSHNDTYAESFHRSFFKDWMMVEPHPRTADELIKFAEGRSKQKMAQMPDSQLAVIGSLVPAIPWILHSAHKSEKECAKETVEFVRLTHPVPALLPFVDMYARLLHAVLNGHDLKMEVLKVLSHSDLGGPSKRQMILTLLDKASRYPKGSEKRLEVYQEGTSMLGSACYIEGAMSSMLFLALEFHDDFDEGVLANANCGGENCHRGAALGALLGAAASRRGKKITATLRDNLNSMKAAAEDAAMGMNML